MKWNRRRSRTPKFAHSIVGLQGRAASTKTGPRRRNFPELVNTEEAARLLRRPAATLKGWRYRGVGCDWLLIEGRVMYDLAVLREYLRQNTRVASVRSSEG